MGKWRIAPMARTPAEWASISMRDRQEWLRSKASAVWEAAIVSHDTGGTAPQVSEGPALSEPPPHAPLGLHHLSNKALL